MKSYKTWEAMKRLTEEKDNNLVFGSKADNFVLKVVETYVRMYSEYGTEIEIGGNINLKDDIWYLKTEMVPALEAIKAFDNGKTIRCEHTGRTNIYSPCYNKKLIDNSILAITSGELLRGKWFIEEAE